MPDTTARRCPACGSQQVKVVPRGYSGSADTPDQYMICQQCEQITYEIVAVSQRDIRLYRYEVNGTYERDGVVYRIRRILKVGFNEYLLYLRRDVSAAAGGLPPESSRPSA